MKITLLQQDIVWANPAANRAKADAAIALFPGADLYVLPEMFSTGFCTQPREIAESAPSETLAWMKQKSAEVNAAIAGSVAVEEGGRFYNRFYLVQPDGQVEWSDKKHLFTYGGEDKQFTAGHRRVIVTYLGVRILLLVCYDLRFPVWSRSHGDYDLILYVASWPTSRIEVWNTLLRARALENQCYVAGVNRVGKDPYCDYIGGSTFIDPYGKTLALAEWEKEDCISAQIDLPKLEAFRRKFPVLDDADAFQMISW